MWPGPWFSIKMSSYQYRKSHCGDKTILRPSYLLYGISYILERCNLFNELGPVPYVHVCNTIYQWLSARLQYLHCQCTGDTAPEILQSWTKPSICNLPNYSPVSWARCHSTVMQPVSRSDFKISTCSKQLDKLKVEPRYSIWCRMEAFCTRNNVSKTRIYFLQHFDYRMYVRRWKWKLKELQQVGKTLHP